MPFFASTPIQKRHAESAFRDACRTSSGNHHHHTYRGWMDPEASYQVLVVRRDALESLPFYRFCDKKTTKGCMTEVPVSKVTAPADKQVGPSLYPCIKPVPSTIAPKPSLSAGELKSLHLNHNDHYCRRMPEHMPGSMFTQCPGDGLWYVIHPDFRMEPGMRGADLGKKGVQPW